MDPILVGHNNFVNIMNIFCRVIHYKSYKPTDSDSDIIWIVLRFLNSPLNKKNKITLKLFSRQIFRVDN